MCNGLIVGAALLRDVSSRNPMGEGRPQITGLLVVICQQLRLRRAHKTVVKFLQCVCDTLVKDLTSALEQAHIGGIAGQGVFEGVNVTTYAAYQQARFDKLSQGDIERRRTHVENWCQQTRRKFTTDCGPHLRNFLDRRHTVEARHKGVVQTGGDCERWQRPVEPPGIGTFPQQPGL